MHGAKPGDTAHLRINSRLDKPTGYSSINRITACGQNLACGVGAVGIGGRNSGSSRCGFDLLVGCFYGAFAIYLLALTATFL